MKSSRDFFLSNNNHLKAKSSIISEFYKDSPNLSSCLKYYTLRFYWTLQLFFSKKLSVYYSNLLLFFKQKKKKKRKEKQNKTETTAANWLACQLHSSNENQFMDNSFTKAY